MKAGDKVNKYHLWDGSSQAGKVLPEVFTIMRLHNVNPQVNAQWFESYAELSDNTFEYVWNLSEVME